MEDPFAGRLRLNQLTPQELLFRNDRMSNQPQTNHNTMSEEELNRLSREHYTSFTSARALQEKRDQQQKQQQRQQGSSDAVLSTPTDNTTSTTTSSDMIGPAPPAPQQQQYELPYGWNERTNQTVSVSDLNSDIMASRVMPTGPTKTQEELEADLNQVFEQCDFIRKEIQSLTSKMFAASKGGETALVEQHKASIAAQRAMLDVCKEREAKIMFEIEKLMENGV